MIKLIIFDWDDVIIIGSQKGYFDCFRNTLKKMNILMSEEEMVARVRRHWGRPIKIALQELIRESPVRISEAENIFYQENFYADTFLNALEEVKGVNDMLIKLTSQYKLAVVTGNHREMLRKIITKFQIPDVFNQIVTSHDDHIPSQKTKPHPYMLELIMETQKARNEEVLYIGDAQNDVIMARNAHVEPVVVLTGQLSKKEAQQLNVNHIIPDVTYLTKIV